VKSDLDVINGSDLGGAVGPDAGAVDCVSDYSPPPHKHRPPKPPKALMPREDASEKVVDLAAFKAKVTIHSSAVFEAKRWKRSRVKKGYLIARIPGYDPVESEYGVHYLKVLSRNPNQRAKLLRVNLLWLAKKSDFYSVNCENLTSFPK
jgi:hypothetical protein